MAYAFIAVGVAGVCLPILPGIPFLLVGMRLLGPDHWLTRPIVGIVKRNSAKKQAENKE